MTTNFYEVQLDDSAHLAYADTNTTSIYTRATGREAREFVARMWNQN